MTSEALNQEILQVSSQLLEKAVWRSRSRNGREIADSLSQLPQQQTDARRQLNEVNVASGRRQAAHRRIRRKILGYRRNPPD